MLSTFVLVMTFWGSFGSSAGGPGAFTVEFHDLEKCQQAASELTQQLDAESYISITSKCIKRN